MGMVRLFSSCSSSVDSEPSHTLAVMPGLPNPNPKNFRIERAETCGRFAIAMIRYPDCTNYEGQKILVFEGVKARDLQGWSEIDPHFCDKPHPSPVARFEPTNTGWKYARIFCRAATANGQS